MSDLRNLIEQLEKAKGPDQALDVMIAEAIGHKTYHGTTPVIAAAPAYTASLDEAITLIPEDREWHVWRDDENGYFGAAVTDEAFDESFDMLCGKSKATASIALCIAALKALEAKR